jgi:hypothetical protein
MMGMQLITCGTRAKILIIYKIKDTFYVQNTLAFASGAFHNHQIFHQWVPSMTPPRLGGMHAAGSSTPTADPPWQPPPLFDTELRQWRSAKKMFFISYDRIQQNAINKI